MGSAIILFDFFFFNDTATTEIYTLSLHDALPIATAEARCYLPNCGNPPGQPPPPPRSEEHTSELQSRPHLVCRLLLEKQNTYGFLCCALQSISNDCITTVLQLER